MASITLWDQRNLQGNSYPVKATSDEHKVEEVPRGKSSVKSAEVEEGTWIVYTENNFTGSAFLLKPGIYKNSDEVKSKTLDQNPKWTGQIRSVRLVTPGSLMLFDNDYCCGECSVIKDSTEDIEDADCMSILVDGSEWTLYEYGEYDDDGKSWKVTEGQYNHADLDKNIGDMISSAKRADRQIGTISFYDKEGKELKKEAPGDEFEVRDLLGELPGDVASINVDKGIWIVYTETYFIGVSFLLKPGEYKDLGQTTQVLVPGEEWTGQIRSLRLVTQGSMMLFDQDNFRGKCLVIKETTKGIGFATKSMIIEPDPNVKAPKYPEVDLVFVLDGSDSIGTDNFEKVKQFAVNVSRGLDISPTTTRIGVVQYSDDVRLQFKLAANTDNNSVERAIKNIKYKNGGTMTGEALKFVRTEMDWRKSTAKRVVIVLTDGESNDPVDTPAKELRQDGFVVYAVGVGPTPNDLTPMVSDQGKVTSRKDFDKLEKEIGEISEGISHGAEWAVCNTEGKEWQAFPGFYTSADLKKNLGGRVGSVVKADK